MNYRGRGRPRKLLEVQGPTPELRAKHARGHTRPPLDNMLEAGVINADAHWAGMHLRRLHVGLNGTGMPQSGFYWMERAGRGEVSESRMEQWQKEYYQAREWLTNQEKWHACIAFVLADEQGVQPLAAWQKGAEACQLLARLWCKKAM